MNRSYYDNLEKCASAPVEYESGITKEAFLGGTLLRGVASKGVPKVIGLVKKVWGGLGDTNVQKVINGNMLADAVGGIKDKAVDTYHRVLPKKERRDSENGVPYGGTPYYK